MRLDFHAEINPGTTSDFTCPCLANFGISHAQHFLNTIQKAGFKHNCGLLLLQAQTP